MVSSVMMRKWGVQFGRKSRKKEEKEKIISFLDMVI
jgi:hypothetical protein